MAYPGNHIDLVSGSPRYNVSARLVNLASGSQRSHVGLSHTND